MKGNLLSACLGILATFFLPDVVMAQTDLAVISTASNAVSPGRNLTYTILVVNNGPGSATNANLTCNLAAGTTFVSFTAPAGWNAITPVVGVNAPVLATILSLASGAIQSFTLVVTGGSVPVGTALPATSFISSVTPDLNPVNNQASAFTSVAVIPTFDITAIVRGFPTANLGDNVVFTIQVVNNAIGAQLGVSFADIMPTGTSFVSLSAPAGWTVNTPPAGSNGIITATIPILVPGAVAAFTLVANVAVNVPLGSTILNTASVTSFTPDLNPGNNFSLFGTRVVSPLPADLAIIKTGPATVNAGDNITYSITVRNNGPNTALNVVLTDNLLPTLTFVSLTAAPGWGISTPAVGNTGVVNATNPSFASGGSATFTLVARVANNLAGNTVINNFASVNSTNLDPVTGNNSSVATTTVTIPCGPISVTIPDAVAVDKGVDINTVYRGYSPASAITLTANISGGTAPYTYLWSDGSTTPSVTVSPAMPTAYRVTVTDARGCKQVSAEKLVRVVDVRCGSQGNKVQVCIIPPGKLGGSYNSCINAGAVSLLLKTGSRLGNCSSSQEYTLGLQASPNPANSYFTMDISSSNTMDEVTLNIYNITGRMVESKSLNSNAKIQIGASYPAGVYLAEVVQGSKKATQVVIKF